MKAKHFRFIYARCLISVGIKRNVAFWMARRIHRFKQ